MYVIFSLFLPLVSLPFCRSEIPESDESLYRCTFLRDPRVGLSTCRGIFEVHEAPPDIGSGEDGERVGQGPSGVPTGEVTGIGRRPRGGLPAGEPLQVPGAPCRPQDVSREGHGLHSDEVDRGVGLGEVHNRRPG
ncbi:uncharacterized protein LOC116202663 [Punica granatum]|uniref:Uncharacterized protein LOC116202663 n=1 Tax=Punica granatum TaxID=22663 RepID=A0A6P8DFK8_PUNGR|nr:uncharacterized protein LOC116202663 [Punica granatum]